MTSKYTRWIQILSILLALLAMGQLMFCATLLFLISVLLSKSGGYVATICGLIGSLVCLPTAFKIRSFYSKNDLKVRHYDMQTYHRCMLYLSIGIQTFCALVCVASLTQSEATEVALTSSITKYQQKFSDKKFIDIVQMLFQCCGIYSYRDWAQKKWIAETKQQIFCRPEFHDQSNKNAVLSPTAEVHVRYLTAVPYTCCKMDTAKPCRNFDLKCSGTRTINTVGCLQQLYSFIVALLCSELIIFIFGIFVLAMLLKFFNMEERDADAEENTNTEHSDSAIDRRNASMSSDAYMSREDKKLLDENNKKSSYDGTTTNDKNGQFDSTEPAPNENDEEKDDQSLSKSSSKSKAGARRSKESRNKKESRSNKDKGASRSKLPVGKDKARKTGGAEKSDNDRSRDRFRRTPSDTISRDPDSSVSSTRYQRHRVSSERKRTNDDHYYDSLRNDFLVDKSIGRGIQTTPFVLTSKTSTFSNDQNFKESNIQNVTPVYSDQNYTNDSSISEDTVTYNRRQAKATFSQQILVKPSEPSIHSETFSQQILASPKKKKSKDGKNKKSPETSSPRKSKESRNEQTENKERHKKTGILKSKLSDEENAAKKRNRKPVYIVSEQKTPSEASSEAENHSTIIDKEQKNKKKIKTSSYQFPETNKINKGVSITDTKSKSPVRSVAGTEKHIKVSSYQFPEVDKKDKGASKIPVRSGAGSEEQEHIKISSYQFPEIDKIDKGASKSPVRSGAGTEEQEHIKISSYQFPEIEKIDKGASKIPVRSGAGTEEQEHIKISSYQFPEIEKIDKGAKSKIPVRSGADTKEQEHIKLSSYKFLEIDKIDTGAWVKDTKSKSPTRSGDATDQEHIKLSSYQFPEIDKIDTGAWVKDTKSKSPTRSGDATEQEHIKLSSYQFPEIDKIDTGAWVKNTKSKSPERSGDGTEQEHIKLSSYQFPEIDKIDTGAWVKDTKSKSPTRSGDGTDQEHIKLSSYQFPEIDKIDKKDKEPWVKQTKSKSPTRSGAGTEEQEHVKISSYQFPEIDKIKKVKSYTDDYQTVEEALSYPRLEPTPSKQCNKPVCSSKSPTNTSTSDDQSEPTKSSKVYYSVQSPNVNSPLPKMLSDTCNDATCKKKFPKSCLKRTRQKKEDVPSWRRTLTFLDAPSDTDDSECTSKVCTNATCEDVKKNKKSDKLNLLPSFSPRKYSSSQLEILGLGIKCIPPKFSSESDAPEEEEENTSNQVEKVSPKSKKMPKSKSYCGYKPQDEDSSSSCTFVQNIIDIPCAQEQICQEYIKPIISCNLPMQKKVKQYSRFNILASFENIIFKKPVADDQKEALKKKKTKKPMEIFERFLEEKPKKYAFQLDKDRDKIFETPAADDQAEASTSTKMKKSTRIPKRKEENPRTYGGQDDESTKKQKSKIPVQICDRHVKKKPIKSVFQLADDDSEEYEENKICKKSVADDQEEPCTSTKKKKSTKSAKEKNPTKNVFQLADDDSDDYEDDKTFKKSAANDQKKSTFPKKEISNTSSEEYVENKPIKTVFQLAEDDLEDYEDDKEKKTSKICEECVEINPIKTVFQLVEDKQEEASISPKKENSVKICEKYVEKDPIKTIFQLAEDQEEASTSPKKKCEKYVEKDSIKTVFQLADDYQEEACTSPKKKKSTQICEKYVEKYPIKTDFQLADPIKTVFQLTVDQEASTSPKKKKSAQICEKYVDKNSEDYEDDKIFKKSAADDQEETCTYTRKKKPKKCVQICEGKKPIKTVFQLDEDDSDDSEDDKICTKSAADDQEEPCTSTKKKKPKKCVQICEGKKPIKTVFQLDEDDSDDSEDIKICTKSAADDQEEPCTYTKKKKPKKCVQICEGKKPIKTVFQLDEDDSDDSEDDKICTKSAANDQEKPCTSTKKKKSSIVKKSVLCERFEEERPKKYAFQLNKDNWDIYEDELEEACVTPKKKTSKKSVRKEKNPTRTVCQLDENDSEECTSVKKIICGNSAPAYKEYGQKKTVFQLAEDYSDDQDQPCTSTKKKKSKIPTQTCGGCVKKDPKKTVFQLAEDYSDYEEPCTSTKKKKTKIPTQICPGYVKKKPIKNVFEPEDDDSDDSEDDQICKETCTYTRKKKPQKCVRICEGAKPIKTVYQLDEDDSDDSEDDKICTEQNKTNKSKIPVQIYERHEIEKQKKAVSLLAADWEVSEDKPIQPYSDWEIYDEAKLTPSAKKQKKKKKPSCPQDCADPEEEEQPITTTEDDCPEDCPAQDQIESAPPITSWISCVSKLPQKRVTNNTRLGIMEQLETSFKMLQESKESNKNPPPQSCNNAICRKGHNKEEKTIQSELLKDRDETVVPETKLFCTSPMIHSLSPERKDRQEAPPEPEPEMKFASSLLAGLGSEEDDYSDLDVRARKCSDRPGSCCNSKRCNSLEKCGYTKIVKKKFEPSTGRIKADGVNLKKTHNTCQGCCKQGRPIGQYIHSRDIPKYHKDCSGHRDRFLSPSDAVKTKRQTFSTKVEALEYDKKWSLPRFAPKVDPYAYGVAKYKSGPDPAVISPTTKPVVPDKYISPTLPYKPTGIPRPSSSKKNPKQSQRSIIPPPIPIQKYSFDKNKSLQSYSPRPSGSSAPYAFSAPYGAPAPSGIPAPTQAPFPQNQLQMSPRAPPCNDTSSLRFIRITRVPMPNLVEVPSPYPVDAPPVQKFTYSGNYPENPSPRCYERGYREVPSKDDDEYDPPQGSRKICPSYVAHNTSPRTPCISPRGSILKKAMTSQPSTSTRSVSFNLDPICNIYNCNDND